MDFFKILKGGVGVGMSNFDRLFAEKHGSGAWQLTTLTSTLPLSFKSKGDPLTDYKLYGTAEGAGGETENLFDDTVPLLAGVLNTDGTVHGASSARNKHTYKIAVEPENAYSLRYEIAYRSALNLCWYDSSENVIASNTVPQNVNVLSMIAPNDARYVSISIYLYDQQKLTFVKSSTQPETYIPYGYKLPMTVESGEKSTTTPIFIGDSKLMASEYVDYESGKIYRTVDGVLTPTDPPVDLPELSTYKGENTLSCGEGLGESSITGYIKGV